MPIQQNPNNRRRGEERSETLNYPAHHQGDARGRPAAMAEKRRLPRRDRGRPCRHADRQGARRPGGPCTGKAARRTAGSPRPGAVMPPAAAASSRRAARGTPPRSAAPCWRRSSAARLSARPPARRKPRPEEDRFRSYRDREYGRSPRGHTRPQHPMPTRRCPHASQTSRSSCTSRPATDLDPEPRRTAAAELPSLPPMPCSPLHPRHSPPSSHTAGHAAGTKAQAPAAPAAAHPGQSTPCLHPEPTPCAEVQKSQCLAFLRRGGGRPERAHPRRPHLAVQPRAWCAASAWPRSSVPRWTASGRSCSVSPR